MQTHHALAAAVVLPLLVACADGPAGPAARPAPTRPGLAAIGFSPVTLVDNTTPGYYNQAIGGALNGTSSAFPNTGTDPTLSFPTAPDLSPAAGILGGWLAPSPLPLNANWSGPAAIPALWSVNTETAVVYPLDIESLGCVRLVGQFGVDNGIFVWRDGEYRFGAMAPGGTGAFEYPNVDLGTVGAGRHYVQVLREDHGGITGYVVRIDAVPVNGKPTAVAGGPYTVPQGAAVSLDGSASSDPDAACGDAIVDHAWDVDGGVDFERAGAVVVASYAAPGTYAARLRVADRSGNADTASATVIVTNVSPTITRLKLDPVTLNGPLAGQSFWLSWTFTDPGATDGPWPWRIDWGDGTVETGTASARGELPFAHTYPTPGARTLRFTIGDRHGGGSTKAIPVNVR